jgi:heme-degrading monooxygenase HmoA
MEQVMILIRDVFRCKPGKSRELAEKFKKAAVVFEKMDGFKGQKVLLDYVAEYWTVVLEAEAESLAEFEKHMQTYASRPEARAAMEGYMELVEGGKREIYRVV